MSKFRRNVVLDNRYKLSEIEMLVKSYQDKIEKLHNRIDYLESELIKMKMNIDLPKLAEYVQKGEKTNDNH